MVRFPYIKKRLIRTLFNFEDFETCYEISKQSNIKFSRVKSLLRNFYRMELIERQTVKAKNYAGIRYNLNRYRLKPNISKQKMFKELGLNSP